MPEANLVWMDLEMTGLNPEVDRIIEIATIVTDSNLNILAEGPVLAIKQSDELLGQMDEWCTSHHTSSGLVARVQESNVTEAAAMEETIKFVAQYVKPGKTPLCGNSIWQDRRFLMRYMTDLNNFFHYRNIDVSTIKELAARWKPDLYKAYDKESTHLALDDIRDSIDELKYYKDAGFVG